MCLEASCDAADRLVLHERNGSTMYTIVWEFVVKVGNEEAFARAYGPDGDWARLFSNGKGYRGTELLKDAERPARYLTIDRWESEEDYERLREHHAAEYKAIDERCEELTEGETQVGEFESID